MRPRSSSPQTQRLFHNILYRISAQNTIPILIAECGPSSRRCVYVKCATSDFFVWFGSNVRFASVCSAPVLPADSMRSSKRIRYEKTSNERKIQRKKTGKSKQKADLNIELTMDLRTFGLFIYKYHNNVGIYVPCESTTAVSNTPYATVACHWRCCLCASNWPH